jgi:hypothetical protein
MDIDGERGNGMVLIARISDYHYGSGLFIGDDDFATATVQPEMIPEPGTSGLAAIAMGCVFPLLVGQPVFRIPRVSRPGDRSRQACGQHK